MKRLFYLLFGLVLLPALLYAQGSLSLKDINDNLTNNYFTKTASDARYPLDADTYDTAEVDSKLLLKADKTYVNATDEAIIIDNDSQDVQIESNRVAITTKADTTYVNATDETIITDLDSAEAKINDLDIINDSQDVAINALNIDVDSAEVAINLNNIDDDSQDVTIEANKVGVASLEVGLQTHQNNPTGAHAATAISATWTNVQVSLDSIEAAIQSIVVGSGFALESWVNSTLETNFYTQAQINSTIEAAIAAIPASDSARVKAMLDQLTSNSISGEDFQTSLQSFDNLYLFSLIANNWATATAVAADTDAITIVAASSTAMNAVAASSTAMNAVAASSTAREAFFGSSYSVGRGIDTLGNIGNGTLQGLNTMSAVAASSTAMSAVAASSTAMSAVAASSTAMNAVAASSTAMNAVAASSTAFNLILKSDTARTAITVTGTANNNLQTLKTTLLTTLSDTNKFTKVLNSAARDVGSLYGMYSGNPAWNGSATKGEIIVIVETAGSVTGASVTYTLKHLQDTSYTVKTETTSTIFSSNTLSSNQIYIGGIDYAETGDAAIIASAWKAL
jgi:hypothetical protein